MDSLGGFAVGDLVRTRIGPPDDAGRWWHSKKGGVTAKVERICAGVREDLEPEWPYLVVAGNYYKPEWLTLVEPKAKASFEEFPSFNSYQFPSFNSYQSAVDNIFGIRYSTPSPFAPPPKKSEHDELIQLRAERDSERRWAAHWKAIADRSEDHFKRCVEAEVAVAAASDALETADSKIADLEGQIRTLTHVRDGWVEESARDKRSRNEAQGAAHDALVARDKAIRARNIGLTVASSVLGSAGYVLYSCWGLL